MTYLAIAIVITMYICTWYTVQGVGIIMSKLLQGKGCESCCDEDNKCTKEYRNCSFYIAGTNIMEPNSWLCFFYGIDDGECKHVDARTKGSTDE